MFHPSLTDYLVGRPSFVEEIADRLYVRRYNMQNMSIKVLIIFLIGYIFPIRKMRREVSLWSDGLISALPPFRQCASAASRSRQGRAAVSRRMAIGAVPSFGEFLSPGYHRPPVFCLYFTGAAKENFA